MKNNVRSSYGYNGTVPCGRLCRGEVSENFDTGLIKGGASIYDISSIGYKFETPPNTAFFWSGRTNGVGGEARALEIANSYDGATIEKLISTENIEMPVYRPDDPFSKKAWNDASYEYANRASGEVKVILGKQLRPESVWETVELPTLLNNSNVTKITAVDPHDLSEEIIFVR
jgi:hypothetical protein